MSKYLLIFIFSVMFLTISCKAFSADSNSTKVVEINRVDDLIDVFSHYQYTIVTSLSMDDCITCMNAGIKITESLQEFTHLKFAYFYCFAEYLNEKEKDFLRKKFNTDYIFGKQDTIVNNYLATTNKAVKILLDNNGIELFRAGLNEKTKFASLLAKHTKSRADLKFSDGKKLDNSKEMLINLVKTEYDREKHRVYILDNIQNQINVYDIRSGKLLDVYKISDYVSNYFEKHDTSSEKWKWKYKTPAYFDSFITDKSGLTGFITLDSIAVDYKLVAKGDTQANVTQLKRILAVKNPGKDDFIRYINEGKYSYSLESIIRNDNSYVLGTRTMAIDSLGNAKFTDDDSDAVILMSDTSMTNIVPLLFVKDIKKITGKKYYQLFGLSLYGNGSNVFCIYNALNSALLTFQNNGGKSVINKIQAHGLVNSSLQYNDSLNLTPEKVFTDLNREFTSKFDLSDITMSDSCIYILVTPQAIENKNIKFILLQSYDFSGNFISEKLINIPNDDKLLAVHFIGIDSNSVLFLNQWKSKGFVIQSIPKELIRY